MKDFDEFLDSYADVSESSVPIAKMSEFSTSLEIGRELTDAERALCVANAQMIQLLRRYHEWVNS